MKNRSRRGFTMVELLMVIATIGVMSIVAIPKFLDYRQEAKVATAAQAAMNLSRAVVGKRITMLNKCGIGLSEWESQVTEKLQEINANDARVAGRCTDEELGELSYRFMDSATTSLFDYMELGQTEVVACLCADADNADCFDMNYNYCLWADEIRIAPNADQVLVAMRTGGGSSGDSGSGGSSGDDGSTGDEGGTSGDVGSGSDTGDSGCTPSYAMDEGLNLCQEQCSGEYVELELCGGGDSGTSGDSGDSGGSTSISTGTIDCACGVGSRDCNINYSGSCTEGDYAWVSIDGGGSYQASCSGGTFSDVLSVSVTTEATHELSVTNNGNSANTNFSVSDEPCGDSGDSGSPVHTISSCTFDELSPGEYTLSLNGTCPDDASDLSASFGSQYVNGIDCSGGVYSYSGSVSSPENNITVNANATDVQGACSVNGGGSAGDSGTSDSGDSGDSSGIDGSGGCSDTYDIIDNVCYQTHYGFGTCDILSVDAVDCSLCGGGCVGGDSSSGDSGDSGSTGDISGCMDAGANNYNPSATIDDGSCTYDVSGCTDPGAENYNASANIDDGSCTYGSSSGDSGDSGMSGDSSSGGDVFGCTDPGAENYNASANIDDGSCTYGSSSGDSGDSGTSGDSGSPPDCSPQYTWDDYTPLCYRHTDPYNCSFGTPAMNHECSSNLSSCGVDNNANGYDDCNGQSM